VPALQDDFERIAMPHSRSLLRVAYRLVSNSPAAEDLVQETMLAGWRSFHQFRPETNVRAWLFRILINKFRSQGRKMRRESLTAPLPEEARACDPGLDDAMEISRALGSLEVEHRTVLLLAAVEGFTCREIAEILAIPIGTVMSRLSRGRQALRSILVAKRPGMEYAGKESL
jgi:RNA polymerase sigma-70 factor (ECF subfamily)